MKKPNIRLSTWNLHTWAVEVQEGLSFSPETARRWAPRFKPAEDFIARLTASKATGLEPVRGEQGLFVIGQAGEDATIFNAPDFAPRAW